MSLVVVTAPAYEPISLQEAKDHLRVTGTDDDALIESKVTAVRMAVEDFLRRRLVTQTLDWRFDAFPDADCLETPVPIQSVTSIAYTDTAGDLQTWSTALYEVDVYAEPGRIAPVYGETWPFTQPMLNAIAIRIVAGYGTPPSVPRPIVEAMLLLLGSAYEHREETITGTIVATLPAAKSLLWNHRLWTP